MIDVDVHGVDGVGSDHFFEGDKHIAPKNADVVHVPFMEPSRRPAALPIVDLDAEEVPFGVSRGRVEQKQPPA